MEERMGRVVVEFIVQGTAIVPYPVCQKQGMVGSI